MPFYDIEQICNSVSSVEVVRPNTGSIIAAMANHFRLLARSQQKRKAVRTKGATASCELSVATFVLAACPLPTPSVHMQLDWSFFLDFAPEIL